MKQKISDCIFMVLATAYLSGCIGMPLAERQQNATTEVSEKWSRNQKEAIKVAIGAAQASGQPATVAWEADNTEAGNGDQSLESTLEQSIPGGLKLLLWVAGLLGLLLVGRIILTKSAAARAAFEIGDGVLARQAKLLEGKLSASGLTDAEKVSILAQLRDLESGRGKLSR